MSETLIELTEDKFDDRFPLVPNHLNPSAGWALGEGRGCLFETYGEELAFVKRQDPRRVWTLIDGDDGDMYVVSSFHYVNRVGYLVSCDPIPDNVMIQVRIPMQPITNRRRLRHSHDLAVKRRHPRRLGS